MFKSKIYIRNKLLPGLMVEIKYSICSYRKYNQGLSTLHISELVITQLLPVKKCNIETDSIKWCFSLSESRTNITTKILMSLKETDKNHPGSDTPL